MTAPKLSGSYFNLLTPGNPKTVKGMKKGFWTFILHFAPTDLSGFQVCPMATAGCTLACLNLAGRGGIAKGGNLSYFAVAMKRRTNTVQAARIRRTVRFFNEREAFMADLVADIMKAVRFCAKHGFTPVFRLNGTSDIRWETIGCTVLNHPFRSVMHAFPMLQFYDYTKLTNRKNVPANYHLTFSVADGNHDAAKAAYASGMNLAVVFRDKATVARYEETGFWTGETFALVVNGDESDLRFLDGEPGKPVVTALYAKGPAKRDRSGFVRD